MTRLSSGVRVGVVCVLFSSVLSVLVCRCWCWSSLSVRVRSANERGIGFRELAAQYEAEFMADMARLGIAPPDVLTRVTEYIPEVCARVCLGLLSVADTHAGVLCASLDH